MGGGAAPTPGSHAGGHFGTARSTVGGVAGRPWPPTLARLATVHSPTSSGPVASGPAGGRWLPVRIAPKVRQWKRQGRWWASNEGTLTHACKFGGAAETVDESARWRQ